MEGTGPWLESRGSRHPLPTSSPQIAPLERFALRDGSEPIKGEVHAGGCEEMVPHTRCDTSPLMGVFTLDFNA
jgi:hypothetical protein